MSNNSIQAMEASENPLALREISSIDDLLDKLLATDAKCETDAIARIQALVYHMLKRVSKEHSRMAEASRQEQIQGSIATMRSQWVAGLTFVAAGLNILSATSGFAPTKVHSMASKVMDLSRFNMTEADQVQSFAKLVSKTLSIGAQTTSSAGDFVSKRNEANRTEYQSKADVFKTLQDDLQAASRDEGSHSDNAKNQSSQAEQKRHDVVGSVLR